MRYSIRGSTIGRPTVLLAATLLISGCQHLPARQSAPEVGPMEVQEQRSRVDNVLTAQEIQNIRVQRFEELLVGRFPGVRVTRVGGNYVVRIRNAGDFMGGGDPLYVVDGMPLPQSSLFNLHPANVQRIEIIKDHRKAYYGVRGANGVILVTTIRP